MGSAGRARAYGRSVSRCAPANASLVSGALRETSAVAALLLAPLAPVLLAAAARARRRAAAAGARRARSRRTACSPSMSTARQGASCSRCRRPTRRAFPAASSMSPRWRPGSARRRSGSTAALAAARGSSSSAASAARSSPRSRIRRFRATGAGRRRAGGRARQLRLFDDLDGRHRRRDSRRPAARRHRLLPHPRRDGHRAGAAGTAGGGEFRLVPELSVADPNSVRVFPRQYRARGAADLHLGRADRRRSTISPRSTAISASSSAIADRACRSRAIVPRRFDPRAGTFGRQVVDFAQPLGRPIVYELANRFRLEGSIRTRRARASAARSSSTSTAPRRSRSAPPCSRARGWWREAFDAAGLIDAFRVEMLPEGVDPLDIRYNVVNWVNRATRGWSYGQVDRGSAHRRDHHAARCCSARSACARTC